MLDMDLFINFGFSLFFITYDWKHTIKISKENNESEKDLKPHKVAIALCSSGYAWPFIPFRLMNDQNQIVPSAPQMAAPMSIRWRTQAPQPCAKKNEPVVTVQLRTRK